MGSEAKASRGEGEGEASAEEAAVSAVEGLLKVPSFWSGEDGRMPGDAMTGGGVLEVPAPDQDLVPSSVFLPFVCVCRLDTGPGLYIKSTTRPILCRPMPLIVSFEKNDEP